MRAAEQPYGTTIWAKDWQISEARSSLPAWREKLRPASDKHRIAILIALSDVVAKPEVLRNGTGPAQSVFWQAYHADLGHLPAIVLSRACGAWRRSGEAWFPTTGQLLNLAKQDSEWRHEATILKGLDKLAKAQSEEPFVEPTAEERADFAERLAALRKRPGAPTLGDTGGASAADIYSDPARFAKRIPKTGAAR